MGFEIITVDEFIERIKKSGIKYKWTQFHHTWRPNKASFNGKNHLKLQQGMKDHHVNVRGFSDIAQHGTLMPDGKIVTGRPLNKAPAGIEGYNTGAFMTEVLGDYDKGKDKLEGDQLEAMIKLQHYMIYENGAQLMFHREHALKSCPGTGLDKGDFLSKVAGYKQVKSSVKGPDIKVKPKYTGLIRKGSEGASVALIQKAVGMLKRDQDGKYGSKTEAFVKDYQKRKGLKPDGIIGAKTWAVLF